jgi:predicted alpha/beta superfamily hydrolase
MRVILATLAFLCLSSAPSLAEDQPPANAVAPETLEQGCIIVVQDRSGLTGISAVYIGTNLNNWTAGDPAWKLQPRSDGRWQIVLTKQPGQLDFKFTRGSWDTVEVAKDLSDLVNRRLPTMDPASLKSGEQPVFELTVERWADQRPDAQARKAVDAYHELKVTGDVRRLQVPGGGGISLVRDLLVWLPPGYDDPANAARRYPVLYMQDGQNLFEQLSGVPGEWRADETATELIASGKMEPVIIVGIPHAGPYRISEYLPTGSLRGQTGRGEQYLQWLIERVMPRVQGAFRVKPGREDTGIGGSSLGALVAMYAAVHHPQVFGKVLAESPALIIDRTQLLGGEFDAAQTWPVRMSIATGGREASDEPQDNRNLDHIEAVKALHKSLDGRMDAEALRVEIEPEGQHNEKAWARRLPAALTFLFPPKP